MKKYEEKDEKMEILKERKNPCFIIDKPLTDADLARLIQSVEEDGLIKAPNRFKENVLKESKKVSVQMAQKTTQLSTRLQLILYGLKVSAAVVGAIFLLGIINLNQDMNASSIVTGNKYSAIEVNMQKNKERTNQISSQLNKKSDAVCNKLNSISNSILNWR